MTVLLALVPLALALGLAGLFAFLWALRNDQYADLDGAAVRVLSDDDLPGETGRPQPRPAAARRAPGPESRP
jgi:cbb3-type cytochrome oxidase maturation protein